MTQREKAICEVFTGICFCAGEQRGAVYEYAEELLGRPVMTHDFLLYAKELKEKARPDFVALCQKVEEVSACEDVCPLPAPGGRG